MNTTVQARVPQKTKDATEEIFEEIGLDMSTAIRMFLLRVEREGGLPFDTRMFNDDTQKTMRCADRGRGVSKPYDNVENMMKDILGHRYA